MRKRPAPLPILERVGLIAVALVLLCIVALRLWDGRTRETAPEAPAAVLPEPPAAPAADSATAAPTEEPAKKASPRKPKKKGRTQPAPAEAPAPRGLDAPVRPSR